MTIHRPAPNAAITEVWGVVRGATGLMWWANSWGRPMATRSTKGTRAMTAKSTEESPTQRAPTMLRAVSGMMKQLTAKIQWRSMVSGPSLATTVALGAAACQSWPR